MKTFSLQVNNSGAIDLDFVFATKEAVEHQNWFYDNEVYKYCLLSLNHFLYVGSGQKKTHIPVGSVEYVHAYMEYIKKEIPLPLNVPYWLLGEQEYLGRDFIDYFTKLYIIDPEKTYWIKHKKIIKHKNNGPIKGDKITEDIVLNFQISSSIKIVSEWRTFILNDEVIDIRNYSGDPCIFPDMTNVRKMVEAGKYHSPRSYTLDVALTPCKDSVLPDLKTVVIECHNFYACGLYGFNDCQKLLQMYTLWWDQFMNGEVQ